MYLSSSIKVYSISFTALLFASCSDKGPTVANDNTKNTAVEVKTDFTNDATPDKLGEKIEQISSTIFNDNNPLQNTESINSLHLLENYTDTTDPADTTDSTETVDGGEMILALQNIDPNAIIEGIKKDLEEKQVGSDCEDLFNNFNKLYTYTASSIKETSKQIAAFNPDNNANSLKKYITKEKNENWMAVNWKIVANNKNKVNEILKASANIDEKSDNTDDSFDIDSVKATLAAGANNTFSAFNIGLSGDGNAKNQNGKMNINFNANLDSRIKKAEIGFASKSSFQFEDLSININDLSLKTTFNVLPKSKMECLLNLDIDMKSKEDQVEIINGQVKLSITKTNANMADIDLTMDKLNPSNTNEKFLQVKLSIEKTKNGKCIIKTK